MATVVYFGLNKKECDIMATNNTTQDREWARPLIDKETDDLVSDYAEKNGMRKWAVYRMAVSGLANSSEQAVTASE